MTRGSKEQFEIKQKQSIVIKCVTGNEIQTVTTTLLHVCFGGPGLLQNIALSCEKNRHRLAL